MQEIKTILDRIMKRPKPAEGDYYVDGILYCGKCNTKKESNVEFMPGYFRIVPVPCKCRKEAIEEQERENKLNAKATRNSYLKYLGSYESKFSEVEFDDIDKLTEKQKMCFNYAKKFESIKKKKTGQKGLLLHGPVGTGKTYFSYCIANQLMHEGYTVFMTTCADAMQKEFQDDYEVYKAISSSDLFIFDDLGAQRDTSYADEIIEHIIDIRYASNRPMIVTTNISVTEMQKEINISKKRIYDRLFEMCYPISFTGESYRLKMANEGFAEMTKTLME